MKKTLLLLLSILACLLSAPGAAQAARPHEVVNDPIRCVLADNGTVTCTGSVAGLGNQAVVVEVDVAFACATRGNANEPGGHIQGQTAPIQPRNGRITFSVSTGPADCPPGLNPVVGDTATLSIFSDRTGTLLFRTTVAITDPA